MDSVAWTDTLLSLETGWSGHGSDSCIHRLLTEPIDLQFSQKKLVLVLDKLSGKFLSGTICPGF